MNTYYKAVRKQGENYRSAMVNGKARITYRMGERTYGYEGTPVLVFKDLLSARRFVGRRKLLVLKGRAGNPHRQDTLARLGNTRWLMRFWTLANRAINEARWWNRVITTPYGTYAADWFTPTSVV